MKTDFKKGDVIKVVKHKHVTASLDEGFQIGRRALVLGVENLIGDTVYLDVLVSLNGEAPCKRKVWSDEVEFVKVEATK